MLVEIPWAVMNYVSSGLDWVATFTRWVFGSDKLSVVFAYVCMAHPELDEAAE